MQASIDGTGAPARGASPDAAKDQFETDVQNVFAQLIRSGVAILVLHHVLLVQNKRGTLTIVPALRFKKDFPWRAPPQWEPFPGFGLYTDLGPGKDMIYFDTRATGAKDDPHGLTSPATPLLHELVHCAFQSKLEGKKAHRLEAEWQGLDEFAAVTITNIYRSAVGLPLRYGHVNFVSLRKKKGSAFERDDRVYRKRWAHAISRMTEFEPVLCRNLGKITRAHAPWNPLRPE